MTDKELKKLNRKELLEMLVIQTRRTEQLEQRVKELEEKLADKTIAMDDVGSLAEAALKLSGVFEAAEKAAELYLENIKIRAASKENSNAQSEG